MSWVLLAYEAVPENKRAAFLNSLDQAALSGVSFDDEKKDYERLCEVLRQKRARMQRISEIESHITHVSHIPFDLSQKLTKSMVDHIKNYGVPKDGFYFDSIGELLKHRNKSRRYYFYYRHDPECIGDSILTSKTFTTVRDVLYATYNLELRPLQPSKHQHFIFIAYDDGRVYFNVTIGPRGAALGRDRCTSEDIERLSKPFTLQ